MNEEWWMMNGEGWLFQVVDGFWGQTDRQTNEQTLVNVESLLLQKIHYGVKLVDSAIWNKDSVLRIVDFG